MRFSLKWDEREGVSEQEGRAAEVVGGAEAEVGALLMLAVTWLGPGEGLRWLLWLTQLNHVSRKAGHNRSTAENNIYKTTLNPQAQEFMGRSFGIFWEKWWSVPPLY